MMPSYLKDNKKSFFDVFLHVQLYIHLSFKTRLEFFAVNISL